MARQLTTSELFRLQLTGFYPEDYEEVQAAPTEAKPETTTKTKREPKPVDVQSADEA